MSSGDTEGDAFRLLSVSSHFKSHSDEFKKKLASLMVPMELIENHVLVHEGDEVDQFLMLESGELGRYKLSLESGSKALLKMQSSIKDLKEQAFSDKLSENAVLVDTVTGVGRVTGFFHLMDPKASKAYATIIAKGGPAKVWVVDGAKFRDFITSNGNFAVEIITELSKKLRHDSKTTRALMKSIKPADNLDTGKKNLHPTMKVLCYDATSWVVTGFKEALEIFNKEQKEKEPDDDGVGGLEISMDYTTERLTKFSATHAAGYDAVCTFVNDTADQDVIQSLSLLGVKMIAQRAAGFDRIDTKAALAYGITVARVPAYSPYAVAEMAISLLMTVNRKVAKASNRVKMANFTLDAGLMGMDIYGKTVGVMGTGKIGQILCNIILGFGAKLICYDVFENQGVKDAGGTYVTQDEIYAQSDVLFLMMPLLESTRHTINMKMLHKLKKGVILINTSRGGLTETEALLEGLKTGVISGLGMDVYENEQEYFFQDWSARNIQDPNLVALLGNNNVVLTAHQAFFTKEAVDKIIGTTIENLRDYKMGKTGLAHPNNCVPVPKF